MKKFELKTTEEIKLMREGGVKLAAVKNGLRGAVKAGVSAKDIEDLAQKLIKKEGAEPSFSKVPGYKWATCINVNDGIVHGIPTADLVFGKNDLVSVDVGLYHKGFHTDTSFSLYLGRDPEIAKFLEVGKKSLKAAISKAKAGKRLGDISQSIEDNLKMGKCNPVRALVGHGIGRDLHEDPMIPCFSHYPGDNLPLQEGMALAIEVMYTPGRGEVKTDSDGWTIRTKDGKISALFEETVAVTRDGPFVLTA